MTNLTFLIQPIWGYNSIHRKVKCQNIECLDVLNYINLEKFGNDNLNFAAILINGHSSKNIAENLLNKIKIEFNSNSFTKLSCPDEILSYVENILQKYEQKVLIDMSNLDKKKSELLQTFKNINSDSKETDIIIQIDKIEDELKSGATIALAFLIKGNIYIYNIGDNQVILVAKNGDSNDIDAQLFLIQTDEDSFHNEKEISRIKEDCGLDPDALRWLSMLSQERCHSRCIGDYEMKEKYRLIDCLAGAKSSPLISTPQNSKYIPFEDNYTHIMLVSSGLFYLVRELIYDTDKVPGEISRKFFEKKAEYPQDTLNQLCKKVLEFFVAEQKKCHDQYISLMEDECQFQEYSQHDDLSLFVIDMSSHLRDSHVTKEDSNGFEVVETVSSNVHSINDSLDKDLSNTRDPFSSIKSNSNYAIAPTTAYVNFDEWDEALRNMSPYEMSKLDLITNIDVTFTTPIVEESESILTSRSTTIEDSLSPELSLFPSFSSEIFNNLESP